MFCLRNFVTLLASIIENEHIMVWCAILLKCLRIVFLVLLELQASRLESGNVSCSGAAVT